MSRASVYGRVVGKIADDGGDANLASARLGRVGLRLDAAPVPRWEWRR